MAKKKVKKTKEEPLTLSKLVKYNQKVLLPAIDKRFEVQDKKIDRLEQGQKDMMLSFDVVFKKLDILIEDKTVRDYQHDREKRLWQIMVDSLKKNKLLTKKQQKEIDGLEVI